MQPRVDTFALAKQMLQDVLTWFFPDRKVVLIGDGACSANNLLGEMDERVFDGIRCNPSRNEICASTQVKPARSKSKAPGLDANHLD